LAISFQFSVIRLSAEEIATPFDRLRARNDSPGGEIPSSKFKAQNRLYEIPLPLWERVRVRVTFPLPLTPSHQGREKYFWDFGF